MTSKTVLIVGLLLCGGAVYALHTDKMRVITVCRDSRLYMEGGFDAELEGGGLNYHHAVKVFQRKNNKDVFLAEVPITAETPAQSPVQTFQNGTSFKLTIFKNQKQTEHGYPAHLDAAVAGDNVSVNVDCMNRTL